MQSAISAQTQTASSAMCCSHDDVPALISGVCNMDYTGAEGVVPATSVHAHQGLIKDCPVLFNPLAVVSFFRKTLGIIILDPTPCRARMIITPSSAQE